MANPYIYNVVTIDGAALIAQATAANPIVYVAAISKATAAESDADLSTKPVSWYDGKAGDIAAVSATDSVARIVAVWRNAGTAQPAKALAVTARLASQTDAEAVVMTAMSDPDSTVVLPGADDVQGGVEVPFNVTLNSADTVAVTPGASASLADLERFVSTHKAGDPTQGEAQSIRGEKSFLAPVTKCRSIEPSAYGASSEHCGSADAPFATAYTNTLKVGVIENIDNPNYAITLGSTLVPSARGKSIGTTAHPLSAVACYNLYINDNSDAYTGCFYLYATEGNAFIFTTKGIAPEEVGTWLGHPDYLWDTVWAENFRGCIPYPTSTTAEPPVGSIVLIWINVGTSLANVELMPGQEVKAQGVGDLYCQQVSPASFADGSMYRAGSSPWILYTGKYRLLSGAKPTGSQGNICYALAIRVE